MKAKGQMKKGGKVEVMALVPGKQVKGEKIIVSEESLQAGSAAANDAINKQNIPREYKKHAKEYFEQVGGTK